MEPNPLNHHHQYHSWLMNSYNPHHETPFFNLTHHQNEQQQSKEPMFEKPLTPSDVGKLNRLVIPKQHAEKYFPLGGGNDSGLLLSFEDELGKFWSFRYSYWTSSQSYVLTKGWSRYVKEKQLDAGDVVLFERQCRRGHGERLFIGWRRRGSVDRGRGGGGSSSNGVVVHGSGNEMWSRGLYPTNSTSSSSVQQHGEYHAGYDGSGKQTVTTTTIGNFKRLRLFGVNMEAPMDITFSTDDDQMGNHHRG